jgi:hypothetical protein
VVALRLICQHDWQALSLFEVLELTTRVEHYK